MNLRDYPRPRHDTGYGFHGSAGTYNDLPADRWIPQLQELGATWVKLVADGLSKLDLARELSGAGIEVVVRLYRERPHPDYVVPRQIVANYVAAGVNYFEWGNEPNLWDEVQGEINPVAVARQFVANRDVIRSAGGIALTPALSPGGHYNHREYFLEFLREFDRLGNDWEQCAVAIHNRPLNHPLAFNDSCSYLEYEWFIDTLVEFADPMPLLGTEAGYEVGWAQDTNFPKIDERLHAEYNTDIARGFKDGRWADDLFCQCFWLWDGAGHNTFTHAWWVNHRQSIETLREFWQSGPFERAFSWEAEYDKETVRHLAWNALGVAYNPEAALARFARAHELGNPVTEEMDYGQFVIQAFTGAILIVQKGRWDAIEVVTW